jgi:hypothetical protein
MITARGRSQGVMMFSTKSSRVLKVQVCSSAERTKVSHFLARTVVAWPMAGSMSATTLRWGLNLPEGWAERESSDSNLQSCSTSYHVVMWLS